MKEPSSFVIWPVFFNSEGPERGFVTVITVHAPNDVINSERREKSDERASLQRACLMLCGPRS